MTNVDEEYARYAAKVYGTPMPAARRAKRAKLRAGQKLMIVGLSILALGLALSAFARMAGH